MDAAAAMAATACDEDEDDEDDEDATAPLEDESGRFPVYAGGRYRAGDGISRPVRDEPPPPPP